MGKEKSRTFFLSAVDQKGFLLDSLGARKVPASLQVSISRRDSGISSCIHDSLLRFA